MATWNQKNRDSVAWPTAGPPRMTVFSHLPMKGRRAGDVRSDPGGEIRQLVPGQEIAAEAEGQEEDEEEEARDPGQLPGLAVGLQEEGREHVDEEDADEDVGRPAVDGADEPAELDLAHDELDALVGGVDRGRVIEQEHDPRGDLDAGQEEGDAAEIVPERVLVLGDRLVLGELDQAPGA